MTPEESEEIRRHFSVLSEELRSRDRFLAEGHEGLRRSLEELRDEFVAFRAEMYAFQSEMHAFRDETREEFGEVKRRVAILEVRPS